MKKRASLYGISGSRNHFAVFAALASFAGARALALASVITLAGFTLTGCVTTEPAPAPSQEEMMRRAKQAIQADMEKIQAAGDTAGTSYIDEVLQPQVISSLYEIDWDKVRDRTMARGKPSYFKIRALYKGRYQDNLGRWVLLQDLEKIRWYSSDRVSFAIESIFNTWVAPSVIPALPQESNTPATFYMAYSMGMDRAIIFVRDVGKPLYQAESFIMANALHFITPAEKSPSYQRNPVGYGIFDPAVYPAIDLFDARVAKDKGQYRYCVSEVIFQGQSETTVTVSTEDGFLTEGMYFGGRATGIKNGEKVRIYYTTTPYWEIQAFERL
jgi:hypothetical protein